MRSNIVRYARWQLQDFLVDRGIALVLIGIMLAAPEVMMMKFVSRDPNQIILRVTVSAAIVFALVSLNGLVSNDRTAGFFRFLFAKPVSPAVFYAQQFAVFFVGLMIVVSALLALFAITVGPVAPWPILWYVALVYLGLGGIAFFISTVTRRDWIVLIAFISAGQILVSLYKDKGLWIENLFFLLPPVEHIGNASKALVSQGPVGNSDVAWILGYSAVFFALGIIVLRRRPFHS